MAYHRPTDLAERPASWTAWPLAERIRAAVRTRPNAPIWAKLSAVAITLNEQPRQIPVNNCCGIMCQGKTRPWGWSPSCWNDDTMPDGYSMIGEGQRGGATAPFLAFPDVEHSLNFLIDRCESRRIKDGIAYARKWVGLIEVVQVQAAARSFAECHEQTITTLWRIAALLESNARGVI